MTNYISHKNKNKKSHNLMKYTSLHFTILYTVEYRMMHYIISVYLTAYKVLFFLCCKHLYSHYFREGGGTYREKQFHLQINMISIMYALAWI